MFRPFVGGLSRRPREALDRIRANHTLCSVSEQRVFVRCRAYRSGRGSDLAPGAEPHGHPPLSQRFRLGRRHLGPADRGRAAARAGAGSRSGTASRPRPGNIADGSRPDVACDHYHRWREDLELHALAGRRAPIGSRPPGRASCPPAAARRTPPASTSTTPSSMPCSPPASTPFVTLNHWDLPQALQDRGRLAGARHGEGLRRVRRRSSATASAIASATGPPTTSPGAWPRSATRKAATRPAAATRPGALRAAHHLLLSHGWAVEVIRRNAPQAEVGIVLNLSPGRSGDATARTTATPRAASTGSSIAGTSIPCCAAATRADAIADRVRRGHLRGRRAALRRTRATWRASARRSTSWASTTTAAPCSPPDRTASRGRCRRRRATS